MLDVETFDFSGKTVLITGAASGIGAAMANEFAEHGARLKLADRNESALHEQADSLQGEVATFTYDQRDANAIGNLAIWAGAVDVLMNNAGIVAYGPVEEHDAELVREVINTNLIGPITLANAVALGMLQRGQGVIVNTTSQLAFCGAAGRAVYASAKAGLAQYTRSAAAEWAPRGVRVVAIAPGRTLTPLNESVLNAPAHRESALRAIPAGRFGEATEMAKLGLILASPAAQYVVGHSLIADGGYIISN